MSDFMKANASEFHQWVMQLGFDLSIVQIEQFNRYADLLVEWNKSRNLTAIDDYQGIFIKHFYDSLSMLSVIGEQQSVSRLLDLGTGAGFPGLPLKIVMPDLRLTLCDSLYKRVEFLEFVTADLGLTDVTIVHSRAEQLALDSYHRASYSHLVSRAVAQLPTLMEWAFPFLMVNGHFYAMKGPSAMTEWEDAKHAIHVLKAALANQFSYELPLDMGSRLILDIKKLSPTPRQFPRRSGEATRHPL
jgi:16S rRNA (guanine527-N7)-methyltransferase